jgi:transposase
LPTSGQSLLIVRFFIIFALYFIFHFMAASIKYHITLTESERETLSTIISKCSSKSDRVKRAYVLLASEDPDLTNQAIASRYLVSVRFVEKLRKRFVEEGFELALSGKQLGGYRISKFDGRVEAHLVSLRCGDAPTGYKRWTLRLLADKMVELSYVDSIGKDSVHTLLKKTSLSLGKSNNG